MFLPEAAVCYRRREQFVSGVHDARAPLVLLPLRSSRGGLRLLLRDGACVRCSMLASVCGWGMRGAAVLDWREMFGFGPNQHAQGCQAQHSYRHIEPPARCDVCEMKSCRNNQKRG